MKDKMLCDLETGICGPVGENAPTTGFIDLSAPQEKSELINEEQTDVENATAHSTEDDTNARA